MKTKRILIWTFKLILLIFLYFPIWIIGTMAMGDLVPTTISEPGLVSDATAIILLGIINTILIVGMIVSSRWHGWRLALLLGLAYYGSFTFITQIETWYFFADTMLSPELIPRLFLMGLSIPLIYIPLAIVICNKWKKKDINIGVKLMQMPLKQLLLKLGVLAVIYLILYWLAGYFIAWQNPELRSFYGSPGEISPFFAHTVERLSNVPDLFLLQLVRGILFAIIAMPLILGSKVKPWVTALLVALLFGVPHLVHIMPNPLMPAASVRLSHMIETATSTFVYGLIIVWLLHRRHNSVRDLFYKS
ncbi:MAG: hypothetical protein ACOH2V_12595 [Candidatus Saccharimonadaceae bacterium]